MMDNIIMFAAIGTPQFFLIYIFHPFEHGSFFHVRILSAARVETFLYTDVRLRRAGENFSAIMRSPPLSGRNFSAIRRSPPPHGKMLSSRSGPDGTGDTGSMPVPPVLRSSMR